MHISPLIAVCGDPFLSKADQVSKQHSACFEKGHRPDRSGLPTPGEVGKVAGCDPRRFPPSATGGSWLCPLLPSLSQPSQDMAGTAPVQEMKKPTPEMAAPKACGCWAGGGGSQLVACLPGVSEVLGSSPNTR